MGEPEPRDQGEAQEERDKPAGLVGKHAGQIPAGLRPPEHVDQRKDQQRDGDGNDRVEKGDEPVEPAFSTHPRRLGTRRGHAFTTPPLIAVITKGTTTNTPSSMRTTSSSPRRREQQGRDRPGAHNGNHAEIGSVSGLVLARRFNENSPPPSISARGGSSAPNTHSCWPGTPSRIHTSSTLMNRLSVSAPRDRKCRGAEMTS